MSNPQPVDADCDSHEPVQSTLLTNLLGSDVAAFEMAGEGDPNTLSRDEAAHVRRAVPRRVAEFAAGRRCAHRALAQLGVSTAQLLVGENREPLWPQGVVGSITHTRGFCGAVAASAKRVMSVGIDAERADAVSPDVWGSIATPEELRRLREMDCQSALVQASLLFSAKEAFFKCQFPLTREWIDFRSVSVTIRAGELLFAPERTLKIERLTKAPWRGRYEQREVCGVGSPSLLLVTACKFPAPDL